MARRYGRGKTKRGPVMTDTVTETDERVEPDYALDSETCLLYTSDAADE